MIQVDMTQVYTLQVYVVRVYMILVHVVQVDILQVMIRVCVFMYGQATKSRWVITELSEPVTEYTCNILVYHPV